METDREILLWVHQRLVNVHKESELVDYMRRLRWIIAAMPRKKISRGEKITNCNNSLFELRKEIKNKSEFEKLLIGKKK